MNGPGRVYVTPRLAGSTGFSTEHPALPPRLVKLARAQIEELIPLTGAAFGLRYVFEADPDGSYGYYNRLASEALAASDPGQAVRLLRAFGARWVLDDQRGGTPPSLRPVTGFEVAGRRLLLSEIPEPIAELRWAGREFRRTSLSGALDLVRSERFEPESDIVLPGRSDRESEATGGARRSLGRDESRPTRLRPTSPPKAPAMSSSRGHTSRPGRPGSTAGRSRCSSPTPATSPSPCPRETITSTSSTTARPFREASRSRRPAFS